MLQQIESEEYMNHCLGSNLAFLRCILNSSWYWMLREWNRDLLAITRHIRCTEMTLRANEISWVHLFQTLYKLNNNGNEIWEEMAAQLSYIQKSTLINEDIVTCAIYFNKLVNVLITLLQSKKSNPFEIQLVYE